MRILRWALGVLAAGIIVSPAAADEVWRGAAAAREEVFWNPADTFWAEGGEAELCARSGLRKVALIDALPRLRTALFERRGQLVGEIRSPADLRPAVTAQAQSCAREAGAAATPQGLLTPTLTGWSTFHAAFFSCMGRNHSAEYVGSMTLWVDQRCNW